MRYSYEFKRKAIELFYQGLSVVAIVAGINSGQLYQWVHKYKILGYNGLINKPKGRPLLADLLISNCCALIAEYSPSM